MFPETNGDRFVINMECAMKHVCHTYMCAVRHMHYAYTCAIKHVHHAYTCAISIKYVHHAYACAIKHVVNFLLSFFELKERYE